MLKITVQKASSLPDVDTFGKSDPFVIIKFQGMCVGLSWKAPSASYAFTFEIGFVS